MLPSVERLRRGSLFKRVYAARKSVSSPQVVLYVLPRNPGSQPKMPLAGFVIGKKVEAKATARNLAKRRVRDAYKLLRQEMPSLAQWYAVVWLINESAQSQTFDQLKAVMKEMIERAEKKYR